MDVNLNKLSKDYTNYTWAFKEKPPKEDLEYLCVQCKLPLKDIVKILNSSSSTVARWLKHYSLVKPASNNAPKLTESMLNDVDWSKMTQNYLEVPHKRGKAIPVEDLKYLYINLNWAASDVAQLFNLSLPRMKMILSDVGLKKDPVSHQESRENIALRKYGVRHTIASEEVREKIENTLQVHYGVKSPLSLKEFKEEGMKKKYGVSYPLQSKTFADKMVQSKKDSKDNN